MTEPLLRISNLRIETVVDERQKGAKPVEILKGVDLSLDRGQVIGLIGEMPSYARLANVSVKQ